MPRKICRSEKMTEMVRFRATMNDVSELKLAAMEKGLDVSTFIRQLLIQAKAITPTGTSKENSW